LLLVYSNNPYWTSGRYITTHNHLLWDLEISFVNVTWWHSGQQEIAINLLKSGISVCFAFHWKISEFGLSSFSCEEENYVMCEIDVFRKSDFYYLNKLIPRSTEKPGTKVNKAKAKKK
jgi:hypothetical protein